MYIEKCKIRPSEVQDKKWKNVANGEETIYDAF
jgi:hypothetical protein